MKILGLQKVTLIDYPGKVACTIFLFGCNFKCGFCHNPELVIADATSKQFSEKEILDFLKSREKYLDGICITGGEPLLTLDEIFLRRIKEIGYFIKIDTNGSLPGELKQFIDTSLIDFVAMDIKNSKEKYSEASGVEVDIGKLEESIKIISELDDYEFRTTVVDELHDLGDIEKIAKWLNNLLDKKPKKFVLQGFKKEGKLLDGDFKNKKDTSEKILEEMKEKVKDYFEEVEVRV
jgi:pyruvate formate lyase activating enzyme